MRVGLVLHSSIAYSETFFKHQIQILNNLGAEVIIFIKFQSFLPSSSHIYVRALPILPKNPRQLFYFFTVLLSLFTRGLLSTLRLFQLERNNGASILDSFKAILINAHILSHKLDYLHFGFATTVFKREFVARAIKAKMTVSARGFDMSVQPILDSNSYNRMWGTVQKIHFVSNGLYERGKVAGLSNDLPFQVIYDSVNCSDVCFKAHLGEIQNPLQILTVGRLHWQKGYTYALIAIQNLLKYGVNLNYTIVGEGPAKEEILYAIRDLGLEKNVFLMGKLPHSEIMRYYRTKDIYIQSGVQEGLGVAILEAQAAGLLVIASETEGIYESIENEKTGWIIPKRDPLALSNQVLKIIKLPLLERQDIARNAIRRVKESFNLEKQQKEWADFFEFSLLNV